MTAVAGPSSGPVDDEDLPPVVVERRPRRTSPLRLITCLAVVGVAVGFLVWKGLSNATVYFKTADEAVAQQRSLGAHRFRVEGIVLTGTPQAFPDGSLHFTIYGDKGTKLDVIHRGGTPELFKPEVPVVLEGHLQKGANPPVFDSDTVIIKHSESYKVDNPDRVKDYGGQ